MINTFIKELYRDMLRKRASKIRLKSFIKDTSL